MLLSNSQYELLDFGAGRKLERFSRIVIDRPCPTAAAAAQLQPDLWSAATARFVGSRVGEGAWEPDANKWRPADWFFENDGAATFQLRLDALPSGQVGVFPEQRENWEWIARRTACDLASKPQAPLRVLNLFAYTGGSTLAAAAAGAEVAHIDAARNIVERARENAALSNLADRPIRWITEDAMKFCRRELKRASQYDAVILDPPTYGHGPKGEPWKIGEDLLPLLKICGELTAGRLAYALVTCHSAGIGPAELAAYLAEGLFGHCGQPPDAGELYLETSDGRRLPSGVYARWPK